MFCPQCGTSQGEELKFCTSCGANLQAVRQVATTREVPGKVSWRKKWFGDMFISHQEYERRRRERELSISPEDKRYNEIKAGVLTSCFGLGLTIFLYVFMPGLILGGQVSPDTAQIIGRLWVAGVLPLFIGIGLLINGLFVSRKWGELKKQELQRTESVNRLAAIKDGNEVVLTSPDWYEPGAVNPGATEHTTRQLGHSGQIE